MDTPEPVKILRKGPPSIHDQAPYGSLCISKIFSETGPTHHVYLQQSKDENNPDWVLIETVIEK